MPDFVEAKIYAIRSLSSPEVYIGATCKPLCDRMSAHKYDCKVGKNCRSARVIEKGDAYIELIERFPCENKEQLGKREGEIIRATENCVNKKIEGRTITEYIEEHKEEIQAYQKAYREQHKEKMKEYQKVYRAVNKEVIRKKHQEYVEANGDKMRQYFRNYYEANKERLKAYQKERREKRSDIQIVV